MASPAELDAAAARLLSQADRLVRLQDTLSRSFARELAATLRDLERQIRVWALQQDATGQISAARAAVLRDNLRTLLRGAGYDRLIDDASAAATDRVLATLTGRDVAAVQAFVTRDFTRIEALRTGFLRAVVPSEDEILAPLWRTVVYSLYSGRSRKALIDDLAAVIDKTEAQTATLYDTAVSAFTRQVQLLQTDDSPDALILYAGPADVRLRPFCRERVGKVFTRREMRAWDNGQLPNAEITLGGYNCRHVAMAVPAESPLAALYGTGERVPSVADALKGLPRGRQKAA